MLSCIAVPITVFVLACLYWQKASALPSMTLAAGFGPGYFPAIVAGFLVLLAALELFQVVMARRVSACLSGTDRAESAEGLPGDIGAAFILLAAVAAYVLLTPVLGFIPAAVLMLLALSVLMGLKPLWRSSLFSVVAAVGLHVVFHEIFGVSFPG